MKTPNELVSKLMNELMFIPGDGKHLYMTISNNSNCDFRVAILPLNDNKTIRLSIGTIFDDFDDFADLFETQSFEKILSLINMIK